MVGGRFGGLGGVGWGVGRGGMRGGCGATVEGRGRDPGGTGRDGTGGGEWGIGWEWKVEVGKCVWEVREARRGSSCGCDDKCRQAAAAEVDWKRELAEVEGAALGSTVKVGGCCGKGWGWGGG